jgi:hypothetical protein
VNATWFRPLVAIAPEKETIPSVNATSAGRVLNGAFVQPLSSVSAL